jgi:hypothetical protein
MGQNTSNERIVAQHGVADPLKRFPKKLNREGFPCGHESDSRFLLEDYWKRVSMGWGSRIAISELRKSRRNSMRYPVNAGLGPDGIADAFLHSLRAIAHSASARKRSSCFL